MAFLAGYNAGFPDLLFYSKAMQGCNAAEWKLGYDDKFHLLNKNNTWKLVLQPRTSTVLGGKWDFTTKPHPLGQIVKCKTCWVIQEFC